jgi:hypothetical protein
MLEAGDPSTTYNVLKVKNEGIKGSSGTNMPSTVEEEETNIFGVPRMNFRDDCTDITYVPAERLIGRSSIIPNGFGVYVEKSIW